MRQITELIIHCSATPEGKDYTVADIDRWHRRRGFQMVGYHFVIRLNGNIEQGRPIEMIGAHCVGHNRNSIGICYIGGLDKVGNPKDTRTEKQRKSMNDLINQLLSEYPKASLHVHNEYANKACPCFSIDEL